MIKTLGSSTLRCQVVIYEPVQPGMTPSVKLYDSNNEPHLKSLLEAKISLSITSVGELEIELIDFNIVNK